VQNPWVPYDENPEKIKEMQEMTKIVFLALNGTGYARSDIRMDKDGKLYMLEINPNCSIFYPDDNGSTADLILMFDGFGKKAFLQSIINYAFHRKRKQDKNYVVRLNPAIGNGIFAARDIESNEMIYQLEETSHILVSRERVEKTWNDRDKEFFKHYAYPLTDDLFVMWDNNPDSWKPINHSCDPNAWVVGLDLHARKKIKKGEEILMDYATMYTENPVKFQCLCASKLCRGTWQGDDYLQSWFEERYGDHVTDFVKQKKKYALSNRH